jgi:hypothetical protein
MCEGRLPRFFRKWKIGNRGVEFTTGSGSVVAGTTEI